MLIVWLIQQSGITVACSILQHSILRVRRTGMVFVQLVSEKSHSLMKEACPEEKH